MRSTSAARGDVGPARWTSRDRQRRRDRPGAAMRSATPGAAGIASSRRRRWRCRSDQSFDVATCLDVIQHLLDRRRIAGGPRAGSGAPTRRGRGRPVQRGRGGSASTGSGRSSKEKGRTSPRRAGSTCSGRWPRNSAAEAPADEASGPSVGRGAPGLGSGEAGVGRWDHGDDRAGRGVRRRAARADLAVRPLRRCCWRAATELLVGWAPPTIFGFRQRLSGWWAGAHATKTPSSRPGSGLRPSSGYRGRRAGDRPGKETWPDTSSGLPPALGLG